MSKRLQSLRPLAATLFLPFLRSALSPRGHAPTRSHEFLHPPSPHRAFAPVARLCLMQGDVEEQFKECQSAASVVGCLVGERGVGGGGEAEEEIIRVPVARYFFGRACSTSSARWV